MNDSLRRLIPRSYIPLATWVASGLAAATELRVSPSRNDANPGTAAAMPNTISAAP